MSFDALVLAGSRGGTDPVAVYAGVSDKALIAIHGRTMLARVVDALRAAGAGRIVAAVSSQAVADHAAALGIEVVAAASGPSESALQALERFGAPLLVTTADHPLLEAGWIAAFLDSVPPDADIAALLAERRAVERDVPATRRTFLRFADGDRAGCNLFYLATPRAAGALALWRRVEAERKTPWRIARRLGPGLLLRYVLGRLTLATALSRLGAAAGARLAAVSSSSGLAAVDVDTPADLELVRSLRLSTSMRSELHPDRNGR